MKKPKSIQVHRFRDTCAISFLGMKGETIYLHANDANQLAACMESVVDDIRARPFVQSTVGTVNFFCEIVE